MLGGFRAKGTPLTPARLTVKTFNLTELNYYHQRKTPVAGVHGPRKHWGRRVRIAVILASFSVLLFAVTYYLAAGDDDRLREWIGNGCNDPIVRMDVDISYPDHEFTLTCTNPTLLDEFSGAFHQNVEPPALGRLARVRLTLRSGKTISVPNAFVGNTSLGLLSPEGMERPAATVFATFSGAESSATKQLFKAINDPMRSGHLDLK